ncbi:MAG TPA: nitrilase-related carbon-nitrogen hydrolase [Rhizomicrobium sp.]|jgi:apolipoprotein N-acyltransferase|nr:nitrilase-related carbon-nitrogen hydrolase [Rhizomicrobium sp.]
MTTSTGFDATPQRTGARLVYAMPNLLGLSVGLVASLLSVGGRWSLPLAAWLAPIVLLRFSRASRPLVAIAAVVTVSFLQMIWMGAEDATNLASNPVTALLTFILGLIFAIPYIMDRLFAGRLSATGRLLLFPTVWAAVEFIVSSNLPVGTSIGVRAFTQGENMALIQIVSLTGPYAIGFLIALGATIANRVWENPSRETAVRWGGGFAAILFLIFVYGEVRLSLAALPNTAPAVKIAGITAPAELRQAAWKLVSPANFPPSAQTKAAIATPAMKALYASVADDLLARTRDAARSGAQIVVWSETAAPVLEADKPALLQKVAALARAEHIYINAAIGVPFERNETYLFSPDGVQLWHYRKNHPVPGLEPVAPFMGDVPVVDTPLGRLANVICYDGDFPALMRVPADILLLPGWDWAAMGYTHTMKMARLRAIENGYSLVRVDYAGVSAAFDPYGRTLAMQHTLSGQRHTLIVDVPAKRVKTLYSLIGDVFAWLCLALALGLCGYAMARPTEIRSET